MGFMAGNLLSHTYGMILSFPQLQATGARIGGVVQAFANIGTAIIIAFIYGWKLTLVILAFLPCIAIAGFLEMKILTGLGGKDKEALEEAGKVSAGGKIPPHAKYSWGKSDIFPLLLHRRERLYDSPFEMLP